MQGIIVLQTVVPVEVSADEAGEGGGGQEEEADAEDGHRPVGPALQCSTVLGSGHSNLYRRSLAGPDERGVVPRPGLHPLHQLQSLTPPSAAACPA